jgi:hypothetical protein
LASVFWLIRNRYRYRDRNRFFLFLIRDLLDRSPAASKRLTPPTEPPPVDTDVDPDFDLDLVAPFARASHPR